MIDMMFFPLGGIAEFTDKQKCSIWASSNNKGFIEDDLPTTSLCRFVGMGTPEYEVTNWADDGEKMVYRHGATAAQDACDLGLVIYHTPGHTPDELAIWDPQERVLFVGDTMYEWAPIIFPLEGNLQNYVSTLFKLRDLIKGWNEGQAHEKRVTMACGHVTSSVDAEDFVHEVETFLSKVGRGLVGSQDKGEARGFSLVGYERDDGKISFMGPKQLFEDFLVNQCPV